MKSFLFVLAMLMAGNVLCQRDTTLTIRVSSIREFPQIGLDLKGRKYFVMSTRQDKAAITALMQGLYADSILTKYDELRLSCDSTITLLQGRVLDRGKTIDMQTVIIRQLEENLADMQRQRDVNQRSIDDLKKQVKRQKVPMWIAYAGIAVGGLILIDNLTHD